MIVLDRDGMRFNYRAVGVALHAGQVLLHRAECDPFWALPGGRVEMLEMASDTLVHYDIDEQKMEEQADG